MMNSTLQRPSTSYSIIKDFPEEEERGLRTGKTQLELEFALKEQLELRSQLKHHMILQLDQLNAFIKTSGNGEMPTGFKFGDTIIDHFDVESQESWTDLAGLISEIRASSDSLDDGLAEDVKTSLLDLCILLGRKQREKRDILFEYIQFLSREQ